MAAKKLQCVKVQKKNGITWVMLNRPEKRNAMSPQLHFEMDETLKELETDPATKVVVIAGAGGYFSAGQDLKEFFRANEKNAAGRKAAAEAANRWRWERLYKYDKPTIAMVEGYCVGGAFMQLCGVDFAIAAEDTVFSLSEVNWGILPGALVSKVVSDMILPRHALYYACMGEAFDGKEAERIGLINFAVPGDQVVDKTVELAHKLEPFPTKWKQFDGAYRLPGQARCAARCCRIGQAPQRSRGADTPHRRPGSFTPWRRCASLPMRGIAMRSAPIHGVK